MPKIPYLYAYLAGILLLILAGYNYWRHDYSVAATWLLLAVLFLVIGRNDQKRPN